MNEKNRLSIRLDEPTHKALKKKIIDSKFKSMQELIIFLIKQWLKK